MASSSLRIHFYILIVVWNWEAIVSQQPQRSFMKVDVELIQLLNPQGLLANGQRCDTTNDCDPSLSIFLDTIRPLMAWPGDKDVSEYTKVFKTSNQNSPIIHNNVSRIVCGGSINKVNLRVNVVDGDTFSGADLIDNFNCVFSPEMNTIANSWELAEWSPTEDCVPLHQSHRVRLLYRYRVYAIPQSECGLQDRTIVKPDLVDMI
ncbi:uncharacterized protein LOC129594165 isoform X2 [Paramacrobiotus metropolitanus]|uniref:uncharacterized protein LOC129594165 isoform X2 n=1 Tax=Paramacrobiotus metropolitanus TaxID=2943436 RepID=UPI00244623F0|nr:uncharacterized protein LOC129594165 isoform X2 [Paramacrobiotus metropolitanus]